MDREEAKNLLELCRPGVYADHGDAVIAEAFAMLDKDAELRAWFETQHAIDERISASLNSIEPPATLKAEILAGMHAHKVHATQQAETEEIAETVEFPRQEGTNSRKSWINPWIGLAAIFAVLFITVSAIRSNEQNGASAAIAKAGVPDLVQFLFTEMTNMKGMDKKGKQVAPLMSYLASNGAPSPQTLTEKISDQQTLGCVVFDYHGVKLSMICFNDESYYHIATIDKKNVQEELPAEPHYYQIGKQAFKLWQDEEQVYILTIKGTEKDIPQFI